MKPEYDEKLARHKREMHNEKQFAAHGSYRLARMCRFRDRYYTEAAQARRKSRRRLAKLGRRATR